MQVFLPQLTVQSADRIGIEIFNYHVGEAKPETNEHINTDGAKNRVAGDVTGEHHLAPGEIDGNGEKQERGHQLDRSQHGALNATVDNRQDNNNQGNQGPRAEPLE